MSRSVQEADALQNRLTVSKPDVRRRRPVNLNFEALRAEIVLRGKVAASERLQRARARGERWAAAVTAETVVALPERQFVAFLWFYWGNLSTFEIAERMSVQRQTVKDFLARARERLGKHTESIPPA